MDSFISFFESIKINTFDVIVSVIVLFNIISSTKKGFVLSVIDKLFGFIFGGITGYLFCVIILSLSNYIYVYDKWPVFLKNGLSYNTIEYGRKIFDEKILFSNEYLDETKDKLKK